MFLKATVALVALAAQALAFSTCDLPGSGTQNTTVSITNGSAFCLMLTGYGVFPVAQNEGCASSYCYGPASKLGPAMPKGYILSANYEKKSEYVQVTGCIDSSVWDQNPLDQGGQMDSHGWPYTCQGYKKFVSLIEPATNTYCIRCCNSMNDCNTAISVQGCKHVVPGKYTMHNGSKCKALKAISTATTISQHTMTTVHTTATTTATHTATPMATCTVGYKGTKQGKGRTGACCKTSADCRDTCVKGVCGVHP